MATDHERERAWGAVHDAIGRMPSWAVGPCVYHADDDLWHVAMITYPQAALGAEIAVPTLDGPTTIKIRPGTQVGEVITLRGKGMPRFKAYGKGDLVVRIGISVPQKLTGPQKELLEQLAKEFGTDVQSRKGKFRL